MGTGFPSTARDAPQGVWGGQTPQSQSKRPLNRCVGTEPAPPYLPGGAQEPWSPPPRTVCSAHKHAGWPVSVSAPSLGLGAAGHTVPPERPSHREINESSHQRQQLTSISQ